ncbi:MAG: hypothetical protein ACREA9_18120, partial [Pyrinomonadaceae bacterium]
MQLLVRQPLALQTYRDLRYLLIKQVEEGGSVSLAAYLDSKEIPTIGLGFNLRQHWKRIAAKFGVDPSIAADVQYFNRIKAIVEHNYTAADAQKLRDDLNKVMADRAGDTNVPGVKRGAFVFADEDEVKDVFIDIADAIYETEIRKWEQK